MPYFSTSYQVIQPDSESDFYSEWDECKEKLIRLKKKENVQIFKINIFVYSIEFKDFHLKKQFIKDALFDTFLAECPANAILAQSPENNFQVMLEIGYFNSPELKVDYRHYNGFNYTVIRKDNYKELWANGIEVTEPNLSMETYSIKAFEIIHRILEAENMTFDNIVRQWNYIGNILQTNRHNGLINQHYQIFNEVRNTWYSRYRSSDRFPAATGIGMNFIGISIDFCAISPSRDIRIFSINNPVQIEPYNYDQEVLVGTPINQTKTPPQFERAKIMMRGDKSRIFVSGTASIIGQKTIGKEDVQKQTSITIENIQTLVSTENLISYSLLSNDHYSRQYRYIRVYVKRSADIAAVKNICTQHFGNIPAIYVQADICRKDLLVEIEAEIQ